MRFHGAGRTDVVSRDYAQADGDLRVSLVAHLGGRVVAVAGYDRLNEPGVAEVAFAVADDMQGRGLATRMLEQLAAAAADRGVRRFDAEVIADNRAMLHVFSSAGFGVRRETSWGEAHLELDIRPSERAEERMAERHHRATVASLRPLLAPASVAVVGASAREGSVGGELLRTIIAGGFAGVAAAVSRGGGVVSSTRAVPAIADLPDPPELVIVSVPAPEVLDAVVEAADAGARGVLVVATGFSDSDEPEGREREEALLAAARARGVRLVGPNSVGLVNTDPAVELHGLLEAVDTRPGGLALSSQSGALGLALLGHAAARRLGVAAFVSLGNRADVSTNDLLEYWADDPRCTVIALYVESFGNPRRFSQVSRRVSRLKPVLAVKGSRTRRVAVDALSHTAAALGDEAAVDALLRQAGILRVEGTEALFDAAELLERQPLPRGRHVGIVTNSGGLGRIASDACLTRRLELAVPADATIARLAEALPQADRVKNPVDLGVRAPLPDYLTATRGLLDDDGVDAVIVVHAGRSGLEQPEGLAELEAGVAGAEKPVVACVVGPDGRLAARESWSVPNYRFPEAAVGALALAADRRDWLSRPLGQRPDLDDVDAEAAQRTVAEALAGGSGWLDHARTAALLATHGLPLVAAEPTASVEEAVAAAARVGGPVALKADAPAPAHPGDADAVLLGLEGEAAVRAGWEALRRRIAAAGRAWTGALVQQLAPAGADVLVGAVADPDLGPVVGVGMGGRQAGLAGDVAFALVPLTDVEVDDMVQASPGLRAWLDGARGTPPLDRPALSDLVLRFARLLEHVPEIAEADLNPVRVAAEGAHVLDARVRVAPRPEPRRAKTW
jgi:acetate---CoA ligase (ADP-forming)